MGPFLAGSRSRLGFWCPLQPASVCQHIVRGGKAQVVTPLCVTIFSCAFQRCLASAAPKSARDQQFWRQTRRRGTATASLTRLRGGASAPGALVCCIRHAISPLPQAQSGGRTAEDARDGGPHQHFWPPSMVLATVLSARAVRRLELSELPSFLMVTGAARSNLVCRPNSAAGRVAWRQTRRNGRANPMRKRVFGGAWPPSSPVRRAARARPRLLAPAERVLLERAQDRVRDIRWL